MAHEVLNKVHPTERYVLVHEKLSNVKYNIYEQTDFRVIIDSEYKNVNKANMLLRTLLTTFVRPHLQTYLFI